MHPQCVACLVVQRLAILQRFPQPSEQEVVVDAAPIQLHCLHRPALFHAEVHCPSPITMHWLGHVGVRMSKRTRVYFHPTNSIQKIMRFRGRKEVGCRAQHVLQMQFRTERSPRLPISFASTARAGPSPPNLK
jgi:hypothetical protein